LTGKTAKPNVSALCDARMRFAAFANAETSCVVALRFLPSDTYKRGGERRRADASPR
jgi:hypothetical protein